MTDATLAPPDTTDRTVPMKAPLAQDPVWNTALDWLERVQQRPQDNALLAACQAWQAESPAHAKAWRKAERIWRLSGELPPQFSEQWSADRLPTPQPMVLSPPAKPRANRRRRTWVGAALAASLVLAVLPTTTQWRADYSSQVGEIRQVQLSDGSLVTLGSDSALADHFDGGARNVELLRGEAYFEVRPDPARPFTVKAGSAAVRVTGTAFDVRLDDHRTQVAVTHGSVKLSDQRLHAPELDTALRAGDQVRLDYTAATLQRSRLQASQVASWRQQQLIANDLSIGELVEQLRRYHRGLILLPDSSLAGETVTGVYDLRDPQAALRAIVQAHGGQLKVTSAYLWIVSRP